jgi:hypothetical protein
VCRFVVVPIVALLPPLPSQDGSRPTAVGEIVPDLPFVTIEGKRGRLSDFAEHDALVLVVRELDDASSAALAPELARTEERFRGRSVAFVRLDATGRGDADALRDERPGAAIVRDLPGEAGRLGSSLGVASTTQALLLDAKRRLRFRGAAADADSRLAAAIEAVLARERVPTPEPDAGGTPLALRAPESMEPAAPPPTWSGRIAAIVRDRCLRCHRPDGAAPFPLLEPADFAGRDAMVRRVVAQRTMPPWFAHERSAAFRNDTRLAADERLDLLRWLQADCPEGEPDAAPLAAPDPRGWRIPEPDLVLELERPYRVPATGVIPYVNLPAGLVLDGPIWIQALEIRPDCPEVVHHMALVVTDAKQQRGGTIDGHVPGKEPTTYPEGTARLLPKGSRFVFNIHFTPNGKPHEERMRIGIVLARTPPTQRVQTLIVHAPGFVIPPRQPDFVVRAERTMPETGRILRFVPHMHLRGRSFAIDVELPDRRKSRPLEIVRWHPDWQFAYDLESPIEAPAGTVVRITSTFDNSAANPFNPDAGKPVYEGPQIFEEMAEALVEYVVPWSSGFGLGPDPDQP